MKRGTFMDIVGIHYDDIKRMYSIRDNNRGQHFNEDAFNEAFVKCATKFCNEIIDYEDAVKYFWIAYVNTGKNDYKYKSSIELCENYSDDLIEDDEKSFAEKFYDRIMNAVADAFSEDDMMMYSLYKYHNWTKEELEDYGYDCSNFSIRIKNIHRFVKEYTKKHKLDYLKGSL